MRYETGANEIKVLRGERCDNSRPAEPLHDDLRRLMASIQAVLKRRYPTYSERRAAHAKILDELKRTGVE